MRFSRKKKRTHKHTNYLCKKSLSYFSNGFHSFPFMLRITSIIRLQITAKSMRTSDGARCVCACALIFRKTANKYHQILWHWICIFIAFSSERESKRESERATKCVHYFQFFSLLFSAHSLSKYLFCKFKEQLDVRSRCTCVFVWPQWARERERANKWANGCLFLHFRWLTLCIWVWFFAFVSRHFLFECFCALLPLPLPPPSLSFCGHLLCWNIYGRWRSESNETKWNELSCSCCFLCWLFTFAFVSFHFDR